MRRTPEDPHWTRHIFYRSERTRTTWKFRFAVLGVLAFAGWLSRDSLTIAIADSLICDSSAVPSDAILVENFDPDYLAFETAARLRKDRVAPRILVPIKMSAQEESGLSLVSLGIAQVMANIAHLGAFEVVPIREVEPISLNAASDILRYIEHERIQSVVVVSPLFRSRRSALVYDAVLGAADISVRCEPVSNGVDPREWADSWHGMQNAVEQWLKLQYYRFYVLPFKG